MHHGGLFDILQWAAVFSKARGAMYGSQIFSNWRAEAAVVLAAESSRHCKRLGYRRSRVTNAKAGSGTKLVFAPPAALARPPKSAETLAIR